LSSLFISKNGIAEELFVFLKNVEKIIGQHKHVMGTVALHVDEATASR